jgi:hypothetical protein
MRPRPDYGESSYTGSNHLLGKKAIITGGDSCIATPADVGDERHCRSLSTRCSGCAKPRYPGCAKAQPSSTPARFRPTQPPMARFVTFTTAFVVEAIKRVVRVNAVAPGPIWTPLIPGTMPHEHVEKLGENTPVGRAGQPAELAPVYVFSGVV